jgi:hypothetical protein
MTAAARNISGRARFDSGEESIMVREAPAQPAPPHRPYPAEKARGGAIILRTRAQRVIFIAGLAGVIVLAVLLAWFAY